MKNNAIYVAVQQLNAISQSYATTVNQAANRLLSQLGAGACDMRSYMELREAKAILKQLRYPEIGQLVRVDEVAWALDVVKAAAQKYAIAVEMSIFEKTADLLGVTIGNVAIPLDMQRKINNSMIMFGHTKAAMPLAQAV